MKLLGVIGLSAFLAAGLSTASMADKGNNIDKEHVTGAQIGPQVSTPSTGRAPVATSNQYGQTYPGQVGPTGSHEPDATNPVRSSPSGGGGGAGGSGGASGGGGGSSGTGR